MNLETYGFVYRISGAEKDQHKHYFWEDELVYAMNCPVKINGEDGIIILPKLSTKTYTVQYLVDGGHNTVKVKFGVKAEQILFRPVEKKLSHKPSDIGKEDGGEKNQSANNKDEEGGLNKTSDKNHTINLQKTNNDLKEDHNNNRQRTASATHAEKAEQQQKHLNNALMDVEQHQKGNNTNNTQVSMSTLQQPNHGINQQTIELQQQFFKSYSMPPEAESIATKEQPSTLQRLNSTSEGRVKSTTSSIADHNQPLSRKSPSSDLAAAGGSNTSTVNGNNQNKPRGKWEDSESACTLTVPMWVTDTKMGLFCKFHRIYVITFHAISNVLTFSLKCTVHIIGNSFEKGQGYKTKEIERATGCSVSIPKDLPMTITLNPIAMMHMHATHVDLAKIMIENSLLEFLESHDDKGRFLNEWTVPLATTSPARKRKPDDDDFFLGEQIQRPTKALKAQGSSVEINPRNRNSSCCVLTVPLWVMQKCTRDNELFCKSVSLLLLIFFIRMTNLFVCQQQCTLLEIGQRDTSTKK